MKSSIGNNIHTVSGLLLTGAGLSMATDAGTVKAKGDKWILYDTLALVIFQVGLCLVADTGRNKSKAKLCSVSPQRLGRCRYTTFAMNTILNRRR